MPITYLGMDWVWKILFTVFPRSTLCIAQVSNNVPLFQKFWVESVQYSSYSNNKIVIFTSVTYEFIIILMMKSFDYFNFYFPKTRLISLIVLIIMWTRSPWSNDRKKCHRVPRTFHNCHTEQTSRGWEEEPCDTWVQNMHQERIIPSW